MIKIICDSIKNTFDLKVKFENSEQNIVEILLDNERDRSIYDSLFFNNQKSELWCNQIIDHCIRGLIKLEK